MGPLHGRGWRQGKPHRLCRQVDPLGGATGGTPIGAGAGRNWSRTELGPGLRRRLLLGRLRARSP
eukprot:13531359-Alexandrium_andersonii.AAC.1